MAHYSHLPKDEAWKFRKNAASLFFPLTGNYSQVFVILSRMTNPAAEDRSFFGHPRGLSTLFFTEMWERFSYYGLRPLLVLFMSAALAQDGFGMSRSEASAIVGIYAASVYLASLPGGWIADRLLGLRRAIMYGAVLISLGHICLGISSYLHLKAMFFGGLILIVLGTGLMKPNVSAIVGELYPSGGSKRDAGFSIFYMGINIGSFFGQIIVGVLGEKAGWHFGFGAAGVGMLIGLAVFALRAKKTLGSLGLPKVQSTRSTKLILAAGLCVLGIAIFLAASGLVTLHPESIGENMTYVLVFAAFAYFAYIFAFGRLQSDERKRVAVIFLLFVFAAIFWGAFEQAPTSLNLFARDFTNRDFLGWTIPATWFQSINSFFVVLCAPLFAALWVALGKRGKDLSATSKFAWGLFLAGAGFLFMVVAAKEVVASGGLLKVSAWWLTLSYMLQSFGELCLSPVGLSSMTKLAPPRFAGQMMGIWFLADSVGSLVAGLVGGRVDPNQLDQMPTLFIATSAVLLVAALLLWLMAPLIRKFLAH